jgi:serine/threonine protein kinase
MTRSSPCPEPEELRQLALGLLPESRDQDCAAHVQQCPTCEAALRALAVRDPLLDAVARMGQDGAPADNPQAQPLPARLLSPPTPVRTPGAEETDDVPAPAARRGAATEPPAGHDKGPPGSAGPPSGSAGARVGSYKLLQLLGEGGMGAVWAAEQTEPVRRRVALKVIKPGMDSRNVLRRFEAERQALALMDHPNIARVFDAGATPDGRPYFAMELVPGIPITKYCDDMNLAVRDRLALFVPVCRAIQHAHQKGVIHRDIKPSNVLVCMQDGRPVPKVIDFGVAKAVSQRLTEETLDTEIGAILGTLEYMAPEQAEVSPLGVDTRADVYALGVLLYELLTGTTPLDRKRLRRVALGEAVRILKEEEPPRPSTRLSDSKESLSAVAGQRRTDPGRLLKEVRGELDWIVMKCLEKDRTRRYETANGLVRDVERYLADEPVEACPPAAGYRLRKFARKHRAALAGTAAFALLLTAGAAVCAWQAWRATRAEADARAASGAEKEARELAERRLVQIEKANDLLAAVFHDLNPRDLSRRGEEEAEANLRQQLAGRLERAAAQLTPALIDDPRTLARLQFVLGSTLHDLGRDGPAVPLLRQAYDNRKELLGPDDPETLAAGESLVTAYHMGGQFDKALPLAEELVARSTARFGRDDPVTLMSQSDLALVLRDGGKTDDAVRLFREVGSKIKERLGPDDSRTLAVLHNLGNAYRAAHRPDEAVPLLEDVLARRKVLHGPDHFATLRTKESLGLAYLGTGRLGRALPLLEDAANKQEIKLGLGHPDTLASLTALGRAYEATGRFDKAIPRYEQVVEGLTARFGADPVPTLASRTDLAVAYLYAGRTADASRVFEQVLRQAEARLGRDQPFTQVARGGLAAARRKEPPAEGHEPAPGANGAEDQATLEAWDHYAFHLGATGRPAQAADEYRSLLAAGLRAFRAGTQRAEQWAIDYCQFVANTGRTDAEATASARAILGDGTPRMLGFAGVLAQHAARLLSRDQAAEAEPLLRDCVAIREKGQPDAWATCSAKAMLGEALVGQKKYADAEPLLRAGYEGMKRRQASIPPEGKPRLTHALQQLVRLYEGWGKPDEAARWRKELDAAPAAP